MRVLNGLLVAMATLVAVSASRGAEPEIAPPRVRVVVKLRPSLDAPLATVAGARSGSVQASAAAAADPAVGALFTRHGVRSATALHPGHLRARRQTGLSEAQIV